MRNPVYYVYLIFLELVPARKICSIGYSGHRARLKEGRRDQDCKRKRTRTKGMEAEMVVEVGGGWTRRRREATPISTTLL